MKKYISIVMSAFVAIMFCNCGNSDNWSIKGKIEGADSTMLLLEAPGVNGWYVLDSVLLDESGDFEFQQPIVGYTEIFRLTCKVKKLLRLLLRSILRAQVLNILHIRQRQRAKMDT